MTAARRSQREAPYMRAAVIALAVLAVITYAVFAKRLPFWPRYEVKAVVASASGLIPGSPVRVAGVEVGEVVDVEGGPGAHATVTLHVSDAGRPVHADATLAIRPRVFLEGGFYVDLGAGSPSAPELEDGSTIPLPQTTTPVQLHQILTRLDRSARRALQSTFAELARGLSRDGARGLREAVVQLPPLLRDAAVVAEAARGREPNDLSAYVAAAARATGAIASRERELTGLVSAFNRASRAVAAHDPAIGDAVREFAGLQRALPRAFDAIDAAAGPLRRFIAAARPAAPLVGPVVRDLNRLRAATVRARRAGSPAAIAQTLASLESLLEQLPRLSLLSRGVFPIVGPISACVRDQVMPALMTPLEDGALSTDRPVFQDFMHAMVGLASAAQNFDANGPWQRYLLSQGSQSVSTGRVPGAETLLGTAQSVPTGSRPVWQGRAGQPPFRPDAPCSDQPRPDLTAPTGPAGLRAAPGRLRRARPAPARALTGAIRRSERAAERRPRSERAAEGRR